jgi:hypothetical protein
VGEVGSAKEKAQTRGVKRGVGNNCTKFILKKKRQQ